MVAKPGAGGVISWPPAHAMPLNDVGAVQPAYLVLCMPAARLIECADKVASALLFKGKLLAQGFSHPFSVRFALIEWKTELIECGMIWGGTTILHLNLVNVR